MKTNKLQKGSATLRTGSFLLLMIVFARCVGPEGPQGPPGHDGLDGAGAYSVIYDVETGDWIGDVDGYEAFLDVPEITEDIYYEGAVLVYRLIEIDPISFNTLPYTYVDNALAVYMDFDAYIGGINLMYKEVFDGVNDTPEPVDFMSFKILIIEGIPLATLKTKVDINDLNAVTRYLNVDNTPRQIQ